MAYASKEGRARINSRSPEAAGQCDRCGFLYNHDHLRWQMDYSGAGIYNKRILVCERCYDTPQQQLKVIVIPPDPLPVLNARPPDYVTSETNYRVTSGQDTVDFWTGIPIPDGNSRITQDYNTRVTQQTGEPPGGLNQLPGTDWDTSSGVSGNAQVGLPYGNDAVPYTGPLQPPYGALQYTTYRVQWNNRWNFGILKGSYWSSGPGEYVIWTTTTL